MSVPFVSWKALERRLRQLEYQNSRASCHTRVSRGKAGSLVTACNVEAEIANLAVLCNAIEQSISNSFIAVVITQSNRNME